MPTAIPSIDNSACSEWTENDINMYNSYDFFMAKTQVERRQQNMIFNKLVRKSKKWTPNHGPTMRGVRVNPSPVLRQMAYPNVCLFIILIVSHSGFSHFGIVHYLPISNLCDAFL